MKLARELFLAITFVLAFSICALPHGGGLDKKGGHYNRKTGEYHQHRTPSETKIQSESPQDERPAKFEGGESARWKRLVEYFRSANGAEVLHWRGETTKRNVSSSKRKRVLARDKNRCVLCGSREKLEVDHKRALMNGGNNRINNLATLCDPCHTDKTRMDSSLRRKRKKMKRY